MDEMDIDPQSSGSELPPGRDLIVTSMVRTWRVFMETATRLQNSLDDRLRQQEGLTLADYHLMVLLAEAPGHRMRMKELSRHMVFSPSRLSYQVGVLCKKGLLRRDAVPEDRRGLYATLTDEGMATFRHSSFGHFEHVYRLFINAIDSKDSDDLYRIMTTLADNLNRLEGALPSRAVARPDSA